MASSNRLFTHIGELLTLEGVRKKEGRRVVETDLSLLSKAAIAVRDGRVAWVGPQKKWTKSLEKQIFGQKKFKTENLSGKTVVPGFVECHTHLVFAGQRQRDLEWRIQGLSYQEIAQKGGGIRETVRATRAASASQLQVLAQERVNRFVQQGVTTLEIKSGYGLDLASELKILKVIQDLKGPELVGTFLGPHSLPPEFQTHQEYLEFVIHNILPRVVKKTGAERVDIFVEKGFFSNQQAKQWFQAAQELGLKVVAHTDQLSSGGSSVMAAEARALSVDHAIHLNDQEISKLATLNTTAVLLPASDLYLQVSYPRARALIDAGVRVALATDFNPGTSPTQDLSLVGVLARVQMKMTRAEVLAAYTYNAAAALDRHQHQGTLEVGAWANFVVLNSEWVDLFYEIGRHPVESVWRLGAPLKIS